jgi:hypothetical protein
MRSSSYLCTTISRYPLPEFNGRWKTRRIDLGFKVILIGLFTQLTVKKRKTNAIDRL